MPSFFHTPKRCLLVQAARWFIDNTKMPLPDHVYRRTPVELEAENSELRELFLALLAGDFDVRGDLIVQFMRRQGPDDEFDFSPPIILTYKSDISMQLNFDDVNFANNEINTEFWKLYEFNSQQFDNLQRRFPSGERWQEELFFRNVTVDFSKLRAYLSGESHRIHPKPTSSGAEKKCERWLVELMQGGKLPELRKADYLKEAHERFAVSERGFIRAWANAIKESGNLAWSRPGRKSWRRIDTPVKS